VSGTDGARFAALRQRVSLCDGRAMAMTKAEMERHRDQYRLWVSKAQASAQQRFYREAVELAVSSFGSVDGMMQYERKYGGTESVYVEAIDIVLRYAPPLFHFQSLDSLDSLLKNQRRIERNASGDVPERLREARALMWDAHRLWCHLERHSDCRQDELFGVLGGHRDRWRSIAEAWDSIGLIRRAPDGGSFSLSLYTRMDEVVPGKCPSCGVVGKAPKTKLLEEHHRPKCHASVYFVLLARERNNHP
jgi:hypothetical protein